MHSGKRVQLQPSMEAECTCEPQTSLRRAVWLRGPRELLASLRFILEGRGDRSGMNLGTWPGVAPEEPQEAASWAKVSLASPKRPHGGRSQEVLVAVPPPERDTARLAQVPGSEGPWDTSASSSLTYGAAAGQCARLVEVSARQQLENEKGDREPQLHQLSPSRVEGLRPAV